MDSVKINQLKRYKSPPEEGSRWELSSWEGDASRGRASAGPKTQWSLHCLGSENTNTNTPKTQQWLHCLSSENTNTNTPEPKDIFSDEQDYKEIGFVRRQIFPKYPNQFQSWHNKKLRERLRVKVTWALLLKPTVVFIVINAYLSPASNILSW